MWSGQIIYLRSVAASRQGVQERVEANKQGGAQHPSPQKGVLLV